MMHLPVSLQPPTHTSRRAPTLELHTAIRGLALAAALTSALSACRSKPQLPDPPPEPTSQPAALEKTEPAPAASAVADAAVGGSAEQVGPDGLKPGWTKVSRRDSLPVCVFPSLVEREKNQVLQKVKKQTLKANSKLAFGVFPPWCLNDSCDENAYLQCWVDMEGDKTLVVNTRYASYHKEGATCTDGCMEVDTACETPELAPGKYVIRHGDKTYKLRVPSVLIDPCFGRP